ncbi:MAG: ribosome biogenesis GTPase Der [Proteobacteria bacterium]|nr:ribosome biogenesis GTPase Der [Pseudomonadota bacterium]MBU1714144.1 ribosome biogenesis GTPase Der [Pseudomonadota bacterium]
MINDLCPLVALVGRPNVGKSALFNRIAQKNKAIVDPTPGVTRDRHFEKVSWGGRDFILVDTGGIESEAVLDGRTARDPGGVGHQKVTDGIQEQTWQAVNDAEIILFVMDGREGLTSEDHKVVNQLRRTEKTVHYLVNKVDGPEKEQALLAHFYELGVEQLWPISAAHGFGLNTFLDHLVETMPESPESSDTPEDAVAIAFIGRPNVGKSSLVNRLLGENRMVVSDVPGTTRDSVDTLLEKNGRHYLLIDTAGIRRKGKVQDKLEKFSVMQALSAMERCHIALILIDADEGITEQDTKIIGYGLERGRACLVLLNKWDLVSKDKKRQKWITDEVEMATRFIGYAPTMQISALTGAGVGKIYKAIDTVYEQFGQEYTTNRLNRVLQKAVEGHSPTLHQGKRIKFYYVTQVSTKPPTFIIFVNYPKGVHFSYYRYLVNNFRDNLGLEKSPLRIVLKERMRKKYG